MAAVAQGETPLELYGLSPAALAWSLTRLWIELRRPVLVVTPKVTQQTSFFRDMSFFLAGYDDAAPDNRKNVLYTFPGYENLPFVELTPDSQTASSRLEAAYTLATNTGFPIIVATGIALAATAAAPGQAGSRDRIPGGGRRTRPGEIFLSSGSRRVYQKAPGGGTGRLQCERRSH